MTFALPGGSIRARVTVVQHFGSDGRHARQVADGKVVGGTDQFAHATSSLTGAGTVVDSAAGLGPARLTYRIVLRP